MRKIFFIVCITLCLSDTLYALTRRDDQLKVTREMYFTQDSLQQSLIDDVLSLRKNLVKDPNDFDTEIVENILQNGDVSVILQLNNCLVMSDIRNVTFYNIREFYIPTTIRITRTLIDKLDFLKAISMGRTSNIDTWEVNIGFIKDDMNLVNMLNELQALNSSIINYISKVGPAAEMGVEIPCFGYNELHFIEHSLYGKVIYMNDIDPLPRKLWKRLDKNLNFSDQYELYGICAYTLIEALKRHFDKDDYELLSDNAYDILSAAEHICSAMISEQISERLSFCCHKAGMTEDEWNKLTYQVWKDRYGKNFADIAFASSHILFKNTNLESDYNEFLSFQQEMKEKGYSWAEVFPYESTQDQPINLAENEDFKNYCISFCKVFKSMLVNCKKIDFSQPYAVNHFQQTISEMFGIDEPELFFNAGLFFGMNMYLIGEEALGMEMIDISMEFVGFFGITDSFIISNLLLYAETMDNMNIIDSVLLKDLLPYVEQLDFNSFQICKDEDVLFRNIFSCIVAANLLNKYYSDQYSETADSIINKAIPAIKHLDNDLLEHDVYINLAEYYSIKKEYQKALVWVEEIMNLDIEEKHLESMQLCLFNIYYETGRLKEAAECGDKYYSSEMFSSSIATSEFYAKMAECHAVAGDINTMDQYLDRYIISVQQNIVDRILRSGSYVREQYWNRLKESEVSLAKACWYLSSDKSGSDAIASSLYDWTLLSKGLLLEVNNKVENLLSSHPDLNVRNRYQQMQDLSARLDEMILTDMDTEKIRLWQRELSRAEEVLTGLLRSEAFDMKQYGWKDVQMCLEDGETAVEIKRLPDGEDFRYIALVLKKGWRNPELVFLALESELMELNTLDPSQSYNRNLYRNRTDSLYNKLWKPLETYFDEEKPVWFSVDGKLHLYNMEVLKTPDGQLADEKYDLRRLSSTRELCRDRCFGDIRKVVLYGGLNYSMEEDVLREISKAYPDKSSVRSRGLVECNELPRYPLPETLDEVQYINDVLSARGLDVVPMTGNDGVEQSFKALSGEKVDVLHLATHGFYVDGKTDYQIGEEELSPMMRAGVMLSGPEKKGQEDKEDGILLAREIADMDLSSVQLVVLSACQTASGEISDDGVFGLQRGFKQAGAGTIIMSLWEVHSDMTMFFMMKFYENMADGRMSKREAFKEARAATRKRYDEDLDWSAFIMLD